MDSTYGYEVGILARRVGLDGGRLRVDVWDQILRLRVVGEHRSEAQAGKVCDVEPVGL